VIVRDNQVPVFESVVEKALSQLKPVHVYDPVHFGFRTLTFLLNSIWPQCSVKWFEAIGLKNWSSKSRVLWIVGKINTV